MTSEAINRRGLTSFFTLFGFIIMSITGLVLYVVPAGRVAYWVTWEMLGLTKTDWGNIHILSSILFIVAGIFHTYFNWKPLMNYFKDRAKKGIKLRRELVISSILSVWIIIGSIWPHPPLSYLLDFNEWIKTTWIVEDDYEPPFGHAELLSLKNFSKKMEINLDQAVTELKSNGIKFDSVEETLETISINNKISPMNLYLMIKKFEPKPELEKMKSYTPDSIEVEFMGTGFGNKTISAICERLGLEPEVAKKRLANVGIKADLEKTMKATATEYNTEAIELMKVLLIDDYQPKIN